VFVGALLVTALVCLCAGLLLSSTPWLVASLLGSVLAGLLIYRNRDAVAISRPARAAKHPARAAERPAQAAERPVSKRAKHAADADPVEPAPSLKRPDPDVWVVDGRPRYHRRGCQIIDGQDAEPVPLSQADEDGFISCSLCLPARTDSTNSA